MKLIMEHAPAVTLGGPAICEAAARTEEHVPAVALAVLPFARLLRAWGNPCWWLWLLLLDVSVVVPAGWSVEG